MLVPSFLASSWSIWCGPSGYLPLTFEQNRGQRHQKTAHSRAKLGEGLSFSEGKLELLVTEDGYLQEQLGLHVMSPCLLCSHHAYCVAAMSAL